MGLIKFQENQKGSFLEKVAKGHEYLGADFITDENSLYL